MVSFLLSGLVLSSCARLLPPRNGEVRSVELVLDTRREPAEPLSGCFIPAIFPAVTRLPVEFLDPIPAGAVFTSVQHEVILKNDGGEMKILQPVIENNKVYLKFAVPSAQSFSQYHVVVTAKYTYTM
jgi:hypothetical protein